MSEIRNDVVQEHRVIRIGADELLPGKNFSLWKSHATCVAAAINLLCPRAHAQPVQIDHTWNWCIEVHLDAIHVEPEGNRD